MPEFEVTVYMNVGSMKVTAESAEEACNKIKDPDMKHEELIRFFNLGYNVNLQVKAKEIKG